MLVDGAWRTDSNGMNDIVFQYFQSLFSSSNPSVQDVDEVISFLGSKISDSMNAILNAPFSAAEVIKSIFDLHLSKAPGLDGYRALFYQKVWSFIGEDLLETVLHILNNNGSIASGNSTLISLIPKCNDPLTPRDCRPISLCNTCYKIVLRTIVNRLPPIISQIIDQNQSAFIPGRLITDNAVVGFECMHWICCHSKCKTGYAAFKLDMSKAYDRVEWSFLAAAMLKMGFTVGWVNLIMRFVSSVTYSFIFNQSIVGVLKPNYGFRQDDPLYPYLFALCAQGLPTIISKALERRLFSGVKIAVGCPTISHLFFADDYFLQSNLK